MFKPLLIFGLSRVLVAETVGQVATHDKRPHIEYETTVEVRVSDAAPVTKKRGYSLERRPFACIPLRTFRSVLNADRRLIGFPSADAGQADAGAKHYQASTS